MKTKVKIDLNVKFNDTHIEDFIEVPYEEIKGLNEEEVKEIIDDYAFDWLHKQIEVTWEVFKTASTSNTSMKVRELIKLLMDEDMDKEVRIYAPCNPNTLEIVGFVSANDKEEDAPVTLII